MRASGPPTRVLFVCTGNICRSPTAEGVARAMAERAGVAHCFVFDSAGTQGYHADQAPDPRTVAAARKRGYDLTPLRARRVTSADFRNFDLLLALDAGHLGMLRAQAVPESRAEVRLLLDYHPERTGQDVPDPYYGGPEGFEQVLDLVEGASAGLITALASAP
ncbi:MAG: low molecular weight phosphotyrosine protein phosphatase [Rhodocyclaceae bacterium]|nr:low molecular weight phosphotyrosine protein phosphatase [Rhodocyclaceae bacterium]MBK6905758.1 low molecular weight phosphotyrosine protein phosphatase [Rhodocyclaceae bacterium]